MFRLRHLLYFAAGFGLLAAWEADEEAVKRCCVAYVLGWFVLGFLRSQGRGEF